MNRKVGMIMLLLFSLVTLQGAHEEVVPRNWKDCKLVMTDAKEHAATWVCVNVHDGAHYEITIKKLQ